VSKATVNKSQSILLAVNLFGRVTQKVVGVAMNDFNEERISGEKQHHAIFRNQFFSGQ
jgi:hypothetical protein